MSNMSYCRFENTVSDLNDCKDVLLDHSDSITGQHEIPAADRLILSCWEIVEYFRKELDAGGSNLEEYIRENYKKGTEDE